LITLVVTLFLVSTPIGTIDFQGNKTVSKGTLLREMLSREGDEYSEAAVGFDIEKIKRLYRTEGFFETEIAPNVQTADDEVTITFTISEGYRPRIERIDIHGGEERDLARYVKLERGDFFVENKISETRHTIEEYYKERGFAYADVRSSADPDSGILTFTVDRGLLHYVRAIDITGLKTCKERVVRREIELTEGELFSSKQLRNSQRNIYNLGFFSTISAQIVRSASDSVDIIFSVRELKSRVLNFGAGVSVPLGFLTSFALEELNLFNQGHRFQIHPSFEINVDRNWETRLEFRYVIPNVTRHKLTFTFLPYVWYEQKTEFTRKTRGDEFWISKKFTDHLQGSAAHQYKRVDIREKVTLPDTIKGATNSVRLQLMADYREEFFNPQTGVFLLPAVEYAGGVFGGDNDFLRFEIEGRFFIPILKNVLAQRVKLGVLQPLNGVAVYEKFHLGGQYSLRGYSERSVGPDSLGDEKYGNLLGNYNLEYRVALPASLGLVGFFDLGYCDNEVFFENSDYLKASAGLGLRYYSPIGPIRLDLGFPLTDPGYELYVGLYHIF
jgi:outer membrane protein insertion porin family